MFLTGCFKVDSKWVLRDDRSADISTMLAVNKLLLGEFGEQIEDCETALTGEGYENPFDDQFYDDLLMLGDTTEVSTDISYEDNGSECVMFFSIHLPPGSIPDTINDGIKIRNHENGSWSFKFDEMVPTEENFDFSELELVDFMLRDLEIDIRVVLPGEASANNAKTVLPISGATEFVWDYKGVEGLKELYETSYLSASTNPEPGNEFSTTAVAIAVLIAVVLMIALAVVLVTLAKNRTTQSTQTEVPSTQTDMSETDAIDHPDNSNEEE